MISKSDLQKKLDSMSDADREYMSAHRQKRQTNTVARILGVAAGTSAGFALKPIPFSINPYTNRALMMGGLAIGGGTIAQYLNELRIKRKAKELKNG